MKIKLFLLLTKIGKGLLAISTFGTAPNFCLYMFRAHYLFISKYLHLYLCPWCVLTSGRHQISLQTAPTLNKSIKTDLSFPALHSNSKTVRPPPTLTHSEIKKCMKVYCIQPALTWHCAVPSERGPGAAGKDVGHKINFLCRLTRTGCSPGPNKI